MGIGGGTASTLEANCIARTDLAGAAQFGAGYRAATAFQAELVLLAH